VSFRARNGLFHREGIGPDADFDAGPRYGGGDGKSFSHARRIGPDRGGAAALAQIVRENPAAAVSLRGQHIISRIASREDPDQQQGIGPKADMAQHDRDVRFVSKGAMALLGAAASKKLKHAIAERRAKSPA
jgi:hypothetical protein